MFTKNNKPLSPLKSLQAGVSLVKTAPVIFIPFLIFAAVEALALWFIYLLPRPPLVIVFGPIIRTFWDEQFLHYPLNFILLPKLASNSRMVLSVILGSLLTGVAVFLTAAAGERKGLKFSAAFKTVGKKYLALFIAILVMAAGFHFSSKLLFIFLIKYFSAGGHIRLLFIPGQLWVGPIYAAVSFVLGLIIQSAFIYAVPALVLDNKKLIPALGASIKFFGRFFIPTLIMVGVPMLLYIPLMVINMNTALLILKFFPEAVLLVLFLEIIVTALVIDPLLTLATTLYYLEKKK
ncbi:MAG: hypothetical protein ACOY0S_01380 [Patescibacteria group bacterium]